MTSIRVRTLLSSMNAKTKTALFKLLPKCPCPDTKPIPYPNAILSVLPQSEKYSLLGCIAEDMLRYTVDGVTLDHLHDVVKKWFPDYTDSMKQKIAKSKTTGRFLDQIRSTRTKLDAVVKGPLQFDTTLRYEAVEGHPDAQTPTQIFEVKMTGQLQKNWKEFLFQVFAYGAICDTASELYLVLPIQEMVWSFDMKYWPKRTNYRDLLQTVAKQPITTASEADTMATTLFRLEYNIGNHVHKGKHLHETIAQLSTLTFPFQIFLGSSLSSKLHMKDEELAMATTSMNTNPVSLYVHSPYIINLSANPGEKDDYGTILLKKNLSYASIIGCKGVVVHVGKYTTQDPAVALNFMRRNLLHAAESATPSCPLLLETPAGQGTELLKSREEFVNFVAELKDPRIGICVDTCHVFACGHDPLQYIQYITSTHPGLLKLVHYNDSATPCGSCKDRHALFGTGHIGLENMTRIAQFCRVNNYPMVIE